MATPNFHLVIIIIGIFKCHISSLTHRQGYRDYSTNKIGFLRLTSMPIFGDLKIGYSHILADFLFLSNTQNTSRFPDCSLSVVIYILIAWLLFL